MVFRRQNSDAAIVSGTRGYWRRGRENATEFEVDLSTPQRPHHSLRFPVYAILGACCGWLVATVTLLMMDPSGNSTSVSLSVLAKIVTSGAAACPIVLLLALSQRSANRNLTWFGVCYVLGLCTTLAV